MKSNDKTVSLPRWLYSFLAATVMSFVAAAAIALCSGRAVADEGDEILRKLRDVIAQRPTAVKKTAIPGLYGVYFNQADAPSQFVTRELNLIGNSAVGYTRLSGPRAGTDLELEESRRFFKALLNDIPKDRLISYRYGSGERKVILFTAYDCPNCRVLERELDKRGSDLNATVYIIPLGLQYFRRDPATLQVIRSIWCSEDPKSAWRSAIVDRRMPAPRSCPTNPDEFANLGYAFPVHFPTSVPTAVTLDGRIYPAVLRNFSEVFQ